MRVRLSNHDVKIMKEGKEERLTSHQLRYALWVAAKELAQKTSGPVEEDQFEAFLTEVFKLPNAYRMAYLRSAYSKLPRGLIPKSANLVELHGVSELIEELRRVLVLTGDERLSKLETLRPYPR